ncbi:ankyrin repeat domain-containing protein [Rickettsiales endosymbiont of Stachyamoeba lipophora]|uniref:ankyrin repeat domain-containing protein n=1 Tax=Rickettsiales endosymbiont of Stachyamoeba lipophora TaxID=2486578 RepID=UPI000F645D86|nr:ankyrin repeat domain-containing protein [Rickettsiales endosymbiont of Stachyamoeba lipophora]AZL15343.1 hypothetical protein EF513_02075 [Rickettsiales endosymbiont of Stachyamoeba lipophora]
MSSSSSASVLDNSANIQLIKAFIQNLDNNQNKLPTLQIIKNLSKEELLTNVIWNHDEHNSPCSLLEYLLEEQETLLHFHDEDRIEMLSALLENEFFAQLLQQIDQTKYNQQHNLEAEDDQDVEDLEDNEIAEQLKSLTDFIRQLVANFCNNSSPIVQNGIIQIPSPQRKPLQHLYDLCTLYGLELTDLTDRQNPYHERLINANVALSKLIRSIHHNTNQENFINQFNKLLAQGANLNLITNYENALSMAIYTSKGEILDNLLAHGANVNARSIYNNDIIALPIAAKFGDVNTFKKLFSHGAYIDVNNLLLTVLSYGKTDIARFLIEEKNANINFKNIAFCNTSFIFAMFHKRFDIAALLIGKGADVNATNPQGETALERALSYTNRVEPYLLEPKQLLHLTQLIKMLLSHPKLILTSEAKQKLLTWVNDIKVHPNERLEGQQHLEALKALNQAEQLIQEIKRIAQGDQLKIREDTGASSAQQPLVTPVTISITDESAQEMQPETIPGISLSQQPISSSTTNSVTIPITDEIAQEIIPGTSLISSPTATTNHVIPPLLTNNGTDPVHAHNPVKDLGFLQTAKNKLVALATKENALHALKYLGYAALAVAGLMVITAVGRRFAPEGTSKVLGTVTSIPKKALEALTSAFNSKATDLAATKKSVETIMTYNR